MTLRRVGRHLAFPAVLAVVAGAACVLVPAGILAGIVGSPHDFFSSGPFTRSTTIAPTGPCSACHVPHGALAQVLWARSLSEYVTSLRSNGSSSSVPNYTLGFTIQCYDCHDFHGGGGVNNVPRSSDFDLAHQPQDIAFGFRKNGTGSMSEDGPGATSLYIPGYYENKPPDNTSANFGADPNLGPTRSPYPTDNTNLLKTGGHYFKRRDPTGIPGDGFDIGDKLPCRDCHDPHAWTSNWQAFIRGNWPTSAIPSYLQSPVAASAYMANAPVSGSRDTLGGARRLCIACHGTSDNRSPVSFSDISGRYSLSAGAIVRPTSNVAEHSGANTTTACVSCHAHNAIDASCADCHGDGPPHYPAGRNPEWQTIYPYPGGAAGREQTHARHVGHFHDNTTRFSPYSFSCGVCHASAALHQDNNVNVVYDFSSLRKGNPPSFQPFTGATYNRSTCANVYCHSLGLSDNTVNPTLPDNTMVLYFRTVGWGTAPLGCNGCHGTTSLPGTVQFGMPEYESGAAGSASANSHAAHVVNNGYECSVCHYNTVAGTYLTGRTIRGAPNANAYHVNGGGEVDFDGTTAIGAANAEGGYHQDNTVPANNKRCAVSCHNSVSLPYSRQPQWGNPGSATCVVCHVTSAADSDQYLDGTNTWFQNNVTANLDNTEWTWSGHGKSSGSYDVSGRPAAALLSGGTGDNPCLYCHNPDVGHKQSTNPFRLMRQDNVSGFSGLGWNATCLICHRKTPAPPGYDPDGTETIYAPKAATAAFVDNSHWGQEHGASTGGKFCWDCHDAHGDRNSSGTGNIFMIHKQRLARQTDNTYGFTGTAGALTANAPVFTGVTTGTNYADNTTYRGICQVCHTLASTAHYRYNYGDSHNEGSRCTTCHPHDMAFAPKKCVDCHGGANGELAPFNGAPKVTRYWTTSGHGHASGPAVECENCHEVGSPSPSTHTTSGSGVFNTYRWNGNPTDNTNANTPHLRSYYLTTGTASQIQVNFDAGCYNGPGGGVSCHAQRFIRNHRHTKDAGYVMRFGQHGTTGNPKAYTWFTQGSYETDFYKSRSPWVIHDVTTNAGVPNPPSAPYYGVCVSCHDPHGTGTTDNTAGGLGTTNHMLRGNYTGGAGSQFCSGACHK